MPPTAIGLIEIKRDGRELNQEEIAWLISAYTEGKVTDYQMSAMAMAIFLNGMTVAELAAWTEAMLHSGDVLDFVDAGLPKVDKHSTGGVGDKISIPLAPMVAACGVSIPMLSGRGLGHTGGTLDKLESIPGFTTGLSLTELHRVLGEFGMVLAGASKSIVPADRKLYALRDATATVPSLPLIASSIMSKKLAEGLDALVLDVKTGSGAFKRDLAEARLLATTMVGIGTLHEVETVALITNMEQPLGREVGNANEIRESIDVLNGKGPEDVTELTISLGEVMLELAKVEGGRERLLETIASGAALKKFLNVAAAQGADVAVLRDTSLLPVANKEAQVVAPKGGYVTRCDALTIGIAATRLGAGRERKKDSIDPGVGISIVSKVGEPVAPGDILAVVRYNSDEAWESQAAFLATAWEIAEVAPEPLPLVLERIDKTTV